MSVYNRKLSLLRRRLIRALKYQKAYAKWISCEYTGEEFEAHVVPTAAFDAELADLEMRTDLTISGNPVANPIVQTEYYEAEFGANVNNPAAACGAFDVGCEASCDIELNSSGACPIEQREDVVGDFDAELHNAAASHFRADIDLADTYGACLERIVLDKSEHVEFEDNSIALGVASALTQISCAQTGISTNAECDIVADVTYTTPFEFDTGAVEMDINSCIDCDISNINMPSIKFDTKICADIGGEVTVSLYVVAYLDNLNDDTLESLADMSLDTEYVIQNTTT